MLYWIIPLAIGAALLWFFLFFRVKEKRVIAVIFKGLVSLMFIATAIVAWQTSAHPQNLFGLFVILALFCGLLGDIFLDLKYVIKEKENLYTVLGFVAFGVGHIFSITGVLTYFFNFSLSPLYIIIPILISIALVAVSLLMEKFTPIKYKKMKPCVILYGFLLFLVASLYFSTSIQGGFNNITIISIAFGYVLFALSDLILNNTYFAPNCNTPIYVISNHLIYYIAQFSIAISLFYL